MVCTMNRILLYYYLVHIEVVVVGRASGKESRGLYILGE